MSKKGIVCAVAECPNSSSANPELSYHRFPLDKKLRQAWIIKTYRKDQFNPDNSRICSRHFAAEDFHRHLRAELLGTQPMAILKPGAKPSLFLKVTRKELTNISISERLQEKLRLEKEISLVEDPNEIIDNVEEIMDNVGETVQIQQLKHRTLRMATQVESLSDELIKHFDKIIIDWKDPLLIGIILFHIVITLTALLTRNHCNFQVVLFLALLLLVYFSENINEVAAQNWSLISNQQYFDRKGMFISLIFSVPILLNCMAMMASWLWHSSELMVQLKRAQLNQNQQSASSAISPTKKENTTKRKKD